MTWIRHFWNYFLSWKLLLVVCVTLLLVRKFKIRKRKGPAGLPVLGYLPFLRKEAHKTLFNLSRKYGPVFSMYLGGEFVIVLNSMEAVKEVLSKSMDRPQHPPNHLMADSVSLSVSNGAVWRTQRNFTIQTLRRLGMGKEKMEERILGEIEELVQKIEASEGRGIGQLLLPSVSNVILSFLISDRYRVQQKRALLDSVLKTMTLYFRPTRVHAYFPSLRPWMEKFHVWGYHQVKEKMVALSDFIQKEIEYHRSTLDETHIRDYVDAFLIAMAEKRSFFTDEMLRGNIQSLLGAGSTPARAAVEWCLTSAAEYPDMQEEVYKEVQRALGSKLPQWSDRHSTPYTMAFIMESMRHHTVIPISMLRKNSRACSYGDIEIPANSIIMTNIWAVHHDSAQWESPNDFWPQHFLREHKLYKPPAFIPFSYGKRICPGEDMAMTEVYLYFVRLLQKYKVQKERADDIKAILGIANIAVTDNIRLISR